MNLGVVGYPGDLISPGDSAYGDHMYEMFLPTEFDLGTSNRLLQYHIDTYGGNSGSPVLVKDSMKAIGVHVLGGSINSASVIGPLGNVFEEYKHSFLAKPSSSFDIAANIPSRAKSFRVVSMLSRQERDSTASTANGGTKPKTLDASSTNLSDSLKLLLDSSIPAHEDPEVFLGKLQSLLEPSMVNAMSDACGDAEGLAVALRFLWDSNKDSATNTESLLSTLAKDNSKKVGSTLFRHKSTILKVGRTIGERSPAGMVLRYGLDAASQIANSDDETLMDHVATGLSVTIPIVNKELPKLGPIGRPIAAMAASALRSVGAQAAAAVSFTSEPSDSAQESMLALKNGMRGAKDRSILAETALHGITHLDEDILKQHQVHKRISEIIKPLAPTIQRADSMLSSIMQPTITKVALASLKTPNASLDASQGATSASQEETPQFSESNTESLNYKGSSGIKPKIGVAMSSTASHSVQIDDNITAQTLPQVGTPNDDEAVTALTEALVAAHPDLQDAMQELVERGLQLDSGSFSNATLFGLPVLLGDGKESEYDEQHTESAVPVSGLAHRAMLAEAALQVMLQLPIDVIKSLDVPDIKSTIDAFKIEGEDESENAGGSDTVRNVLTGLGVGVAAGSVASTTLLGMKGSKDKDKELEEKKKDRDTTQIGQNLAAVQAGYEQPHKDVKHWDPHTKDLIDPKQPRSPPPRSPPPVGPPPRGQGPVRGQSGGGLGHGGTRTTSTSSARPRTSNQPSGSSGMHEEPPRASGEGKQPALTTHQKPATSGEAKSGEGSSGSKGKSLKGKESEREGGQEKSEEVPSELRKEEPKGGESEHQEVPHKREVGGSRATTKEPHNIAGPSTHPRTPAHTPKNPPASTSEHPPARTSEHAPVHGSSSGQSEPHSRTPGFMKPTTSSQAKKHGKSEGPAEGLLEEEDPESLVAESFLGGFASE